jgi:hypothetical protein
LVWIELRERTAFISITSLKRGAIQLHNQSLWLSDVQFNYTFRVFD